MIQFDEKSRILIVRASPSSATMPSMTWTRKAAPKVPDARSMRTPLPRARPRRVWSPFSMTRLRLDRRTIVRRTARPKTPPTWILPFSSHSTTVRSSRRCTRGKWLRGPPPVARTDAAKNASGGCRSTGSWKWKTRPSPSWKRPNTSCNAPRCRRPCQLWMVWTGTINRSGGNRPEKMKQSLIMLLVCIVIIRKSQD